MRQTIRWFHARGKAQLRSRGEALHSQSPFSIQTLLTVLVCVSAICRPQGAKRFRTRPDGVAALPPRDNATADGHQRTDGVSEFECAFFSPASILTFSQFCFGGSGQVAKSVNAQGGL